MKQASVLIKDALSLHQEMLIILITILKLRSTLKQKYHMGPAHSLFLQILSPWY